MIATIAVVAVIAEKKKFGDCSDHSDYKESTFQLSLSLESGFLTIAIMVAIAELFFWSAITAIVAMILRPGFK